MFEVYSSLNGFNACHQRDFRLSSSFLADFEKSQQGELLNIESVPKHTLPAEIITEIVKDCNSEKVKQKDRFIKHALKIILESSIKGTVGL